MNTVYFAPTHRELPEREDLLVAEILTTGTGDRGTIPVAACRRRRDDQGWVDSAGARNAATWSRPWCPRAYSLSWRVSGFHWVFGHDRGHRQRWVSQDRS